MFSSLSSSQIVMTLFVVFLLWSCNDHLKRLQSHTMLLHFRASLALFCKLNACDRYSKYNLNHPVLEVTSCSNLTLTISMNPTIECINPIRYSVCSCWYKINLPYFFITPRMLRFFFNSNLNTWNNLMLKYEKY